MAIEPSARPYGEWLSFHLYSDRGYRPILLDVVDPAVAKIFSSRLADRFFFIRYWDEGGLHIRLRIRSLETHAEACWRLVDELSQGRCVAKQKQFEPEVERYGGEIALGHSLDFFSISSVHALAFESSFGDKHPTRRMSLQICLLLWQAWGLSRSIDELQKMLGYFSQRNQQHNEMADTADRFFDRNPAMLTDVVELELKRLVAIQERAQLPSTVAMGTADALSAAASALSSAITGIEGHRRWDIGTSQMHMTANRLGLTNAEESYGSRLLLRAFLHLSAINPELWRCASRDCEVRRHECRDRLSELTQLNIEAFLRARASLPLC